MLADTAHGHVFISQGPDAGADAPIVVTNLSGTQVATIGAGARGLALSANDETLYAAIGDTMPGSPRRRIARSAGVMDSGSAVLTMCTSMPFPCCGGMSSQMV